MECSKSNKTSGESEPLNRLLKEIKDNPFATKDELAVKLGKSRATITRQIQKLKEMSVIRRAGSDKKGNWEVVDD